MNSAKKKRLEANGWKVGSTAEFLNLSPEEAAYVELKVALSKALQELRRSKKLTQVDLAKRIKSMVNGTVICLTRSAIKRKEPFKIPTTRISRPA